MCGMCPDYVASCWICTQPMRGHPDKTTGKQFYLDMGTTGGKFCEHFIERYKTNSPSMYYHIEWEHAWESEYWGKEDPYDCEDHCVENGWYTRDQVVDVVNSFMHWGTP